jgi:hypothetical protein
MFIYVCNAPSALIKRGKCQVIAYDVYFTSAVAFVYV